MPSTTLTASDFTDGAIALTDLLIKTGLAASKGEGKRLIVQGGVSVDDQKMTDPMGSVPLSAFEKGHVMLRKGKKVFHKALLSD